MAETIRLNAQARETFGKGAARRFRRDGVIPAVIYSHGGTPDHVTLPGHETMLALRQANVLLTIEMPDGSEQLALPKQIQRHPIKDNVMHVDLLRVIKGEKVSVQVPIYIIGEQADPDCLVNQDLNELAILAEATSIPAFIEVSIDGLELGDQILAADVKLPEGCELEEDPEYLVVAISAPISEEELEADLEGDEGELEEPGQVGEDEDEDAAEGSDQE